MGIRPLGEWEKMSLLNYAIPCLIASEFVKDIVVPHRKLIVWTLCSFRRRAHAASAPHTGQYIIQIALVTRFITDYISHLQLRSRMMDAASTI
jgi:hypothetical protein